MTMENLILLTLIFFGLHSCNSKIFSSTWHAYATNIELDLNSDSTFNYRMRSDMSGDGATGIYKIQGNTINLYYNPEKIESSTFDEKTGMFLLSSRNTGFRPNYLYIKNRKLFVTDSTGKIKYPLKKGKIFL